MPEWLLFVVVPVWYIVGALCFIYSWTRKYDLTTDVLPLVGLCGFLGPIGAVVTALSQWGEEVEKAPPMQGPGLDSGGRKIWVYARGGHRQGWLSKVNNPRVEPVVLEGGERILAHKRGLCKGPRCPIHKRSNHHMRTFPQHWRRDRGIMERICPHGVGHPDPDDPVVIMGIDPGIHGCDGCCQTKGGAGEKLAS